MKRVAPFLLSVLAGPVLADCPTRDDLQTGIRFTLASGETETFKRTADSKIESLFSFGGGDGVVVILEQGLYLLRTQDVVGGKLEPQKVVYQYETDPALISPLVVGQTRRAAYQVHAGAKLEREIAFFSVGQSFEKTYGDCTYEVWPIEGVTHPTPNLDIYHYLPALGLSYLASYSDGKQTDQYTYVSIEAVQ